MFLEENNIFNIVNSRDFRRTVISTKVTKLKIGIYLLISILSIVPISLNKAESARIS